MSRLLLTVSAVIRTPCRTGLPAPPAVGASSAPLPEEVVAADCRVPNPDEPFVPVPLCGRGPKPLDDEPLLLPLSDSRSALDVDDVPDPGAIWLPAVSREADDDPPTNISVSTRAIWRASPYFTRYT